MPDGSIFAGFTADGKQQIYAMPQDIKTRFLKRPAMTFNDAAKNVKKLNANKSLGHDDWQIPSLENLRVLQRNQNKGHLKGTFKTVARSGSAYPCWYWSSTEDRSYPSNVHGVRFLEGYEKWFHKDNDRLSCRPVRLEPVR